MLVSWTGLVGQSFQFWQPGVSGFPQVAQFQDQFTFYFYLQNNTTQSYTGQFKVQMEVNGGPTTSIDSVAVQNFNVGDSLLFVLNNYTIDSPPYVLGRNGVVIWIVDDDLAPVTTNDSFDVFIVDRPAFRIGNLGLVGFPSEAATGDQFDFSVHIENTFQGEYYDSLRLELAIGDYTFHWDSPGRVFLPAGGGYLFEIENFTVESPPFFGGVNAVRARAYGTDYTLSIPNHEQFIDVAGPVRITDPAGSLGLYPHPLRREFRLDLPPNRQPRQLRLFNLQGETLAVYPAAPFYAVPEEMPPGMYILMAEFRDGARMFQRVLRAAP